MGIEDLEFYLARGNLFGFQTNSDDGTFIGWIALTKARINTRIFALLNENDVQDRQELINQETPYIIRICKVPAERFNANDYLTEIDFVEDRLSRFKTLA